MTAPDLTPDELQAAMEAARISFERWRSIHRPRLGLPRADEAPSPYDDCRTVEDDRLDDPRHGQADAINRGR